METFLENENPKQEKLFLGNILIISLHKIKGLENQLIITKSGKEINCDPQDSLKYEREPGIGVSVLN